MPTYAQLQAESWWGREIIPQPLKDLGARLSAHYNRPATAAGTKGDNVHLSGSHRSQEWIKRSRWCTNRSYTVQSGLTTTQARYIAGFDFNPGSTTRMIEICSRLDLAVRAGTLEQVREWYGNDDGDNRVDGYNNVANRIASSDTSHLWHLHVSFDRRLVNNSAAVKAVGDVLLGVGSGSGGDTTVPVPSGSPLLQNGSTGTEVRQLQAALNEAIDAELTVDGDFGPATETAVKAFQRSAGLTADGLYGPTTAAALRKELSDMPLTKADVNLIFNTDNIIKAPTSAASHEENTHWTASSYLASIRNYAVAAAERAGEATALAAVAAGKDVTAAVRAELTRHRALLVTELEGTLGPAVLAGLREQLDDVADERLVAAAAAGTRLALGSLDETANPA